MHAHAAPPPAVGSPRGARGLRGGHLLAWLAVVALWLIPSCDRHAKNLAAPTEAAPPSELAPSTPSVTPRGTTWVLAGGRVMTASGVIYERADVVVTGDRIVAVGRDLPRPAGATVIDASGKTVTPGLIDTHSHIGVYASPALQGHADGNEAVTPITAEVWSAHGYWPQDPQIDRARAGGITTMQILPGSANLIGGRSVTVKTYRDRRSAEAARFEGAPTGLKMACGENPKRVYAEKGGPQTRMGNIARVRTAFEQARAYQRKWLRYEQKKAKAAAGRAKEDEDPPEEPDRDLGLEALVAVMRGDVLVHNHCYRADEMAIMMDLAQEFGFRIRSFHHAVEAYKVADLLAEHGAAASVWADWWGFKAEAYDGIRANAAIVSAAGARAIIHSDSAEGIQRLNQEAAKAMHAGHRAGIEISEDEALRWITLNPAWALGVDDRVGSLEPGKQADLVVWDGSPFSVYTKAQQVFVEGQLVFDRERDGLPPRGVPGSDFELGQPFGTDDAFTTTEAAP